MKAVANFTLSINGELYEKGKQYDIDKSINGFDTYGGDYFTEVEEVVEKETAAQKKTREEAEEDAKKATDTKKPKDAKAPAAE